MWFLVYQNHPKSHKKALKNRARKCCFFATLFQVLKYPMECKFIKHGIALSYDQIVKPCCEWKIDDQWRSQNQIHQIKLESWHQSPQVLSHANQLENNSWPAPCLKCEKFEQQGRGDSMRYNGNKSYADYIDDDITLEIRPGSVCNFACQTCWPAASSRVAQFHHRAGLIDIKSVDSRQFDDFDFLKPIAHRIRNVVLLGGEPFYDKACKKFLSWSQSNLNSDLMMFTNGSLIDFDFLRSYPGKITVIFSLDAVGLPAEYIRFGTVWDEVLSNYRKVRMLKHVETRVNITCSVYNYSYLEELIKFLCQDWPDVVTFGRPNNSHFLESAIPVEFRGKIIDSLTRAVEVVKQTDIEDGQRANAINAINSHIENLQTCAWTESDYDTLCDFVTRMDQVKNISVKDYCTEFSDLLK
jgi:MoaA/NifB/PqqE/SkfB family radical SAM enzyme